MNHAGTGPVRLAIRAATALAAACVLAACGSMGQPLPGPAPEPFAEGPAGWDGPPLDLDGLSAGLAEGRDPGARFSDGATLFHWVLVHHGFAWRRAEAVTALLDAGAGPGNLDGEGGSLLHLLLAEGLHLGDERMLRLLAGLDVNVPDASGRGLLALCADRVTGTWPDATWHSLFRAMLAAGADPDHPGPGRESLVLTAARRFADSGSGLPLLALLLESEADFGATNAVGRSAWEIFRSAPEARFADRAAYASIEAILSLPSGFDTEAFVEDAFRLPHRDRVMARAFMEGDMARTGALFTRGATLDITDRAFVRVLHFGPGDAVERLCALGMDPLAALPGSPMAAWDRISLYRGADRYRRMLALLRSGVVTVPSFRFPRPASGDESDEDRLERFLSWLEPREALLLDAARAGRWEELASLAARADGDAIGGFRTPRDADGLDPLSLAVAGGAPASLIADLAGSGLDADARDRHGVSALMRAAAAGLGESVIGTLLAAGARADGRDLEGRTAADHARGAGLPIPAPLAATPTRRVASQGGYAVGFAPRTGDQAPDLRVFAPLALPHPRFADVPAAEFELSPGFLPDPAAFSRALAGYLERPYWVMGDRLLFLDREAAGGKTVLRTYRILAGPRLVQADTLELPAWLDGASMEAYEGGALFSWTERGSDGADHPRLTVLDLADARGASLGFTLEPETLPVPQARREAAARWFRCMLGSSGGDPIAAHEGLLRVIAAIERAGGYQFIHPDTISCMPGIVIFKEAGRDAAVSWLGIDVATGESRRLWPGSPSWAPSAMLAEFSAPALALPGGSRAILFRGPSDPLLALDFSPAFEPSMAGREAFRPAGMERGWVALDASSFASGAGGQRLAAYGLGADGAIRRLHSVRDFSLALEAGDTGLALTLARAFVDLGAAGADGRPAWFAAIRAGLPGLSADLASLYGSSGGANPVAYALRIGQLACAEALATILPSALTDPDDPPLFAAAAGGRAGSVELALRLGADPSQALLEGTHWENALSHAADRATDALLAAGGVPAMVAPATAAAPRLVLARSRTARTLHLEPSADAAGPGAPAGEYLLLGNLARPETAGGGREFWIRVRHPASGREGWALASWFEASAPSP